MKKILLSVLGIVMLFLLISCGEEETVPTIPLEGWQEYVIVRADRADEATVLAAVSLKKGIEARTGVLLDMTTDWVKKGEDIPIGTKEILVGSTNRPESGIMGYQDYQVKYEGGRVVINGGSAAAVQRAVDWFLENCVGEEICVLETPYSHEESYPYADVTVDGIPLREFALAENMASGYAELAEWLANATGVYPANSGEHMLVIRENSELKINEVSAFMQDGDIIIEVGVYSQAQTYAAELFKEAVTASSGGEMTLMGKVELEMKQIEGNAAAMIAEWRAETDARIEEILASPNMTVPEGAEVYYVSPDGNDAADGKSPETAWKSLAKVNGANIQKGSYVCFERGGLWRGQLKAKPGMTYTAYGIGDKPKIYASPLDGADASLWTKTDAENIWVFAEAWTQDVGTLVFNHGEANAIKCVIRTEADGSTFNNTTGEPFKTYADLTTDLHFWHDYSGTGKLYLYSEENPGERFDSIEFNIKQHVIAIGGNDIVIDNLCIKYGGAHGVGAGTVKNLTVQNCEFGWIGGSIQAEGIFGRKYGTRYGNAVEIYGGCDTYTVTDNYIYQIYDAGITQQVGVSNGDVLFQQNMTYARNVIEYCNYSIEYFISGVPAGNPSRMMNFLIEDNLMWYAAEGFCEQRPDHNEGAHIKGWSGGNRNRATGYVIRNNLMCGSKDMLLQIMSDLYNPDGSDSMPTLSGNRFVGKAGGQFGTLAMDDTTRQIYGGAIAEYVGSKSDGTDVFWME